MVDYPQKENTGGKKYVDDFGIGFFRFCCTHLYPG